MSHKGRTVEEYISSFPAPVQDILHDLRRTIRTALPGMEETIRYDMPAVMLNGAYVVHYAAWKHHIGLYPIPVLDTELEQDVSRYRAAKDTMRIPLRIPLRLPLREPIPHDLLGRLVTALAKERAYRDG